MTDGWEYLGGQRKTRRPHFERVQTRQANLQSTQARKQRHDQNFTREMENGAETVPAAEMP
jgi:hypothetical protein